MAKHKKVSTTAHVNIRLPMESSKEIKMLAEASGWSDSRVIVMILQHGLNGLARKSASTADMRAVIDAAIEVAKIEKAADTKLAKARKNLRKASEAITSRATPSPKRRTNTPDPAPTASPVSA